MIANTGRVPSASSSGPAAASPTGPASIAIVITAVISFGRSASGVRVVIRPTSGRSRSSERLVEIWLERGFRALLEAIVHEDPEWLAVQIEATRRVRTDERFREQVARLAEEAKRQRQSRFERLHESIREDVPIEVTLQFLSFVANGLAIARTTGGELPDLDLLNELVESGVGRR